MTEFVDVLRLAVFEERYVPGISVPSGAAEVRGRPSIDVVSAVIDPAQYEVVAANDTLQGSAEALLAMKRGEIAMPHVIIIGDHLRDGHLDYVANPVTFGGQTTVQSRDSSLRPTTKSVETVTSLLPIVDREGRVTLFVKQAGRRAAKMPRQFRGGYERSIAAQAPAAFILANTARLLLPPDIRLIGVSGMKNLRNTPLDAIVSRYSDSATEELRAALEHT